MMGETMSGKIYAAMAAIMKETDAIGKDQKNQQQGFQYRGIDDIYNAMHSVLAKHGVFMTPEVIDKAREERTNAKGTVLAFTILRIRYTFWAEDGSSVSCTVEGEGMDSGDKSSNKAMSIAHKYAMLQVFCIPTTEQKDPDAETHEVKSKPADTTADGRAHYKTVMAEIDGAMYPVDVDKIIANRAAWITNMPDAGRTAINQAAKVKRESLGGAA
jgi:hypothetical protein